ncbi:hypothetical protein DVU_1492 [Nitratidesulfovibrio vulgaris str. Hildenborough]|uniref:Uncharacterized protein n=1 Tax=Nitratidesulfovibrio vulgaris (strain ATCC 29579 / DSM 644 / CCUG 34227 / NCIMB 8303 / VKM B-1760 / Hildenborough) TaxID=882 RepID=Q72BZ2_NITV2|nr:hypothetical protein DVU_1492 [Nitratidesulfovibrio vulgaris str. Hildenborough]
MRIAPRHGTGPHPVPSVRARSWRLRIGVRGRSGPPSTSSTGPCCRSVWAGWYRKNCALPTWRRSLMHTAALGTTWTGAYALSLKCFPCSWSSGTTRKAVSSRKIIGNRIGCGWKRRGPGGYPGPVGWCQTAHRNAASDKKRDRFMPSAFALRSMRSSTYFGILTLIRTGVVSVPGAWTSCRKDSPAPASFRSA